MNAEIFEKLAEYSDDPLGYVYWAYPWLDPRYDLRKWRGPDVWQRRAFTKIGNALQSGEKVVRIAIKSGHGIGKSAFSSMLADWGMSTFEGARGIVTAGTERQLRTRTWVEFAKWRRLSMTKDLFKLRATSLHSVDPEMTDEWRYDMSPWSERNTEAFAGLHNEGKRLILMMDEASAIHDLVWEVAEGAMTDADTQIIWVALGNPTKNTGRFRECFDDGKFAHRWMQETVNSMEAATTNKEQLQQYIDDYGIDHDFTRVRVLGEFPRSDVSSLISREDVMNAIAREVGSYVPHENIILGVDVARFGDDNSVIFPRQGRDARSRPIELYKGLDTMQLASRVAECFEKYGAHQINVDETGLGAGVVDRLRQLGFPVYGVNFSGKPEPNSYNIKCENMRAGIWLEASRWMKGALLQDFTIDQDYTIVDDLITTNYAYNKRDAMQLEAKELIKSREGRSPDVGDALALTFAFPSLATRPRKKIKTTYTNSRKYNPYQRKEAA